MSCAVPRCRLLRKKGAVVCGDHALRIPADYHQSEAEVFLWWLDVFCADRTLGVRFRAALRNNLRAQS